MAERSWTQQSPGWNEVVLSLVGASAECCDPVPYLVVVTSLHLQGVIPNTSATLCIISRLIKHMVKVISHSLPPEQCREVKIRINLIFANKIVAAFRLTDDEFTNLFAVSFHKH